MADLLLSQSLIENSNSGQTPQRDPFQGAQQQYQSRQGDILSSSPTQSSGQDSPSGQSPTKDFSSLLSGLGISSQGIAQNQVGRMQLQSRLQQQFGENYMQNPQAIEALKSFDDGLKKNPTSTTGDMTKGIEAANRTLGALFGSSS